MSDDEPDVDVASILARLNAGPNLASEDIDQETAITSNGLGGTQDESIISTSATTNNTESRKQAGKKEPSLRKDVKLPEVYSVRDDPEEENENKRDILAEHADTVNLSPAIMSEPEKYLSLLAPQPLTAVFESVRSIFATNAQQIVDKQKGLVDYIHKTKENSNMVLSHYLQKNMQFSKYRHDELKKKMDEIKEVDQDGQKVKHYLLMLIKRLEELEEKVDYMLAAKAKNKSPSLPQQNKVQSPGHHTTLDEETKE